MTNTALKAQIDSQITNETTAASITPTDVGTNLKAVVDYVDQQLPYKSIVAGLDIDSSDVPTGTIKFNNLCTSISWAKTGTGVYVGTIVGGTFTEGKTFIPNRRYCLFSSATPLNVYLNATGTTLTVSFDDGNAAIKGSWIDFEVKVYN